MLEALLPQVAEAGSDVEVWVLDNASDDNTAAVVDSARHLGPLNYHRNEQNLGPLINVIKGPTELATGEYVWVLGDHNLLRPGALKRVLEVLKANPERDAFYANFRCASYPDQWPQSAWGGYDGPIKYNGNPDFENRPVSHWWELIQGGPSAYCTQVYAHIVRKTIWTDYWKDKTPGEPYTSARTTYPHTVMIAETLWSAPSFYIGEPVLTIFNGAQSWGKPETTTKVLLGGFPELLKLFQSQGWACQETKFARIWAKQRLGETLGARFVNPSERHLLLFSRALSSALSSPYLIPVVCGSFVSSECCGLSRGIQRILHSIEGSFSYLFRDCRPARWIRRSRF